MSKPNNKVGYLLIIAEVLLPVLAYLDCMIDYGKNTMLALSVLIVLGLCIIALVLFHNHKISKWLFLLALISGIALLGSNIIAYNSTGYTYSAFLGRDMFWFDEKLFYTSLSISGVILLATYIVFKRLLKKNEE